MHVSIIHNSKANELSVAPNAGYGLVAIANTTTQ